MRITDRFKRIIEGDRYAILAELDTLLCSQAKYNARLIYVPPPNIENTFYLDMAGIGFQKGSNLTDHFNLVILTLQQTDIVNGLIQQSLINQTNFAIMFEESSEQESSTDVPTSLSFLIEAFYLLAIGFALSFLLLIFNLINSMCKKCTRRRRSKVQRARRPVRKIVWRQEGH